MFIFTVNLQGIRKGVFIFTVNLQGIRKGGTYDLASRRGETQVFTTFKHFAREVSTFLKGHFTRQKTIKMKRNPFSTRPPNFGQKLW